MTASYRSPDAGGRGLDPLDCLPIAAYVDEVDDAGTTRLVYNSPRYADLTGFPPATFADDPWAWDERVHPDDRAAYDQSFDRLWRGRADQDIEYRFRRSDGSWVWLHDRATATRDGSRG